MSSIMLGDMSASSMGMPLADYVHLQRRPATRVLRGRRGRWAGIAPRAAVRNASLPARSW
ncbi:hypothetical protein [Georgenia sp. H159]|uniref:hypothetical protein n=1 Tax=Georgenia sp. H159 TaxID=3076115 RepID=UPI002D77E026|nr:hypothetical protein [Georgenia sp. H159]